MDEFQRSTREIANKVGSHSGFDLVTIEDYDFRVDFNDEPFLVSVSPYGPEEEGRKVEIFQGDYRDLWEKDLFNDEPMVSITGFDERGLGGAAVGFISNSTS